LINHWKGIEKSSDFEHIADGALNSSKNQLAPTRIDLSGEVEEGAETVAAQELQLVKIQPDGSVPREEEAAAVGF